MSGHKPQRKGKGLIKNNVFGPPAGNREADLMELLPDLKTPKQNHETIKDNCDLDLVVSCNPQ